MLELLLNSGATLGDALLEGAQILFELGLNLGLISERGAQRLCEQVEPGMERFYAEFFRRQLFEAPNVTLAGFRDGEEGLGDQSAERRSNAQAERTRDAKKLVEAVRDENHFVARDVMKHAIVVLADAVPIPMDDEGFDGGKVDEALDIEKLFEALQPFDHIGLARGLDQALEIGAVVGVFAGLNLKGGTHFTTGPSVVEVALSGSEVAFNELFVGPLDEDEQSEVALIESDEGMSGARGGHAERVEEVAGKLLAKIGRILDGIVEVDFA